MSKVTIEDIKAKIANVQYVAPFGTTLTVCVITLQNGFNVTGESACVDPANYDAKIGADIAYNNAVDKVWLLEGYALAERLHVARLANEAAAATGVTEENKKVRKPRVKKEVVDAVAEPEQPAPVAAEAVAPAKPRRADAVNRSNTEVAEPAKPRRQRKAA